MAKKLTYLEQLRFDPQLERGFIARYLKNPRLVILLLLGIITIGIASFLSIPKVLNPDVKIPIVIISTALPGANPQDVESLVTIPIEDSVSGLTGIDTVTSTSQDSVSIVTLQFNSTIDPDKAKQDVKSAVDSVTTLPQDAKTPNVQRLDFQNIPIWSFTLATTKDTASLMRFGKILKQKLTDAPHIKDVTLSGMQEEEIVVLLKPESIASYHLTAQQVAQAITSATASYPAGSVQTDASTFSLTIDPSVLSIQDLRILKISINGTQYQLSDLARIQERTKPNSKASFLTSSSVPLARTIRFDVYKKSSSSIDTAIQEAKDVVSETTKTYPAFQVHSLLDTGNEIDKQFKDLIRDLSITVCLVFLILFLFLGVRQALVSSLAIPLTFLITFIVMHITHIDLSFIAFFSLLLSLGLLVDDTVVVISAMSSYHRGTTFTPLQTGLLVWKDFLTPIFTTTVTTVWAFLPLLLSSGIIGEFIKPVPIVASSTLLASFGVAMFITLPLTVLILKGDFPKRVVMLVRFLLITAVIWIGISLLPKTPLFMLEVLLLLFFFVITYTIRKQLGAFLQKKLQKRIPVSKDTIHKLFDSGVISFVTIGHWYKRILHKILTVRTNRRKALIMVCIFSLFSYVLLPFGFVHNEFFPKTEQDSIALSIELPSGTKTATSEQEAKEILKKLRTIQGVDFITADVGITVNNESGGNVSASGGNTIYFTLVLPEKQNRTITSLSLAKKLREMFATYTKGTASVIEESGGPPAGSDVQMKLFGDDLLVLDQYADKLQDFLKKQPGIINVSKSVKPGTSKLVFVPDINKMAEEGVSLDQLGFTLRTYASGFTVESKKFDSSSKDDEDITIRTSLDTPTADTINTITVPTLHGTVPLASLGSLVLKTNPTHITREKGKRTLSVSAGVIGGTSIPDANAKLEKYVQSLNLPSGYSWGTGGANEENQKSVTSILQAMLLSFMLILTTMVIQFQSFRKALIVMLVIPLSISGVFILFSIVQIPLSFPALIGVLALFGIVVKNSILIVDKINHNIRVGIPFLDALIDGAESRLEPIALTSFTAIIGLIPITLSNALWQGLGGAIIAGLTFSGTIMLFFLPVVYYYLFRSEQKA